MDIEEQLIYFFIWLVCGMGIGSIVDGYRAWLIARRNRKYVFEWDCAAWCALAVGIFLVSFYLNGADIRIYFFLALGGGYLVYRRIFGSRIVRLWSATIRGAERILAGGGLFVRTALTPIRILFGKSKTMIRYMCVRLTILLTESPKDKR